MNESKISTREDNEYTEKLLAILKRLAAEQKEEVANLVDYFLSQAPPLAL